MLSNQWLTEITPSLCNPCNPPKNDRVTGFHVEKQYDNPVTFVTQKNDIGGDVFCVPHDSIPGIGHCNNHNTFDPFATMRVLNRMRAAGFTMHLNGSDLVVSPFSRLTAAQRAFIRAHKPALVALLQDAETLHEVLVQAGPAGLGWMEGTPADWTGERLLAAGEVLYGDGRMVNVLGRRYCPTSAPSIEEGPEVSPGCGSG